MGKEEIKPLIVGKPGFARDLARALVLVVGRGPRKERIRVIYGVGMEISGEIGKEMLKIAMEGPEEAERVPVQVTGNNGDGKNRG